MGHEGNRHPRYVLVVAAAGAPPMTTILADAKLGVMAADSNITDGSRSWPGRKVYRIRGALIGLAGTIAPWEYFLAWYRDDMPGEFEYDFDGSEAMVLTPEGLWLFDNNSPRLQRVESGREAIGSGSKAAICAHEALDWSDPRRAVRIAVRHDSASRPPVRLYRLMAGPYASNLQRRRKTVSVLYGAAT